MKDTYPTIGSCGKDLNIDAYCNSMVFKKKEKVKKKITVIPIDCKDCFIHNDCSTNGNYTPDCNVFIPNNWWTMEYKKGEWYHVES